MRTIIFCMTNDIVYDRRIIRCAETLSRLYNIEIICRKLHKQNYSNPSFKFQRVKCLFNKGFLFYAEYNLRLFFLLLFKKCQTIVAVDYDTLIPAVLAGKMKGCMIGLDAHEYFEESIEITARPRIKRFWEWVGAKGIPKVDFAYTVSQSIADIYSIKHAKHFDCVRNLPLQQVQSEGDNHKFDATPRIILYQGVLNKGRQLEILIDASEYLNEHYEIWIIGEGDDSQFLKELADDKMSKCKISFHSWISPDLLHDYTQKAYIAYNLLDNSSQSYYYSLANKFFDYIQAGVPSINSPFPEYQYYAENYDCCYLSDAKDGHSLADFILRIDRQDYIQKCKKCAAAAGLLNWETESKRLIEIFQKFD